MSSSVVFGISPPGSDAYNAKLSQRRADAVKAYFDEHGDDAGRISAEGMGESTKYSNRTGDGRWMDRRVELLFGEAPRAGRPKDGTLSDPQHRPSSL